MWNKKKKWLWALLPFCAVLCLATGCDKLKTGNETEKETQPPTQKVTEAVTEAPTEAPTQAPTEAETEAHTERQTDIIPKAQPETETMTEAPAPVELTVEEELAQEVKLDQLKTMYAMDDINVRTKPGTDGEIIDSFDQGEKVIVSGETPNWAVVELSDYDVTGDFDATGYVSKRYLSESEVPEKSSEEREEAILQELAGMEDGSQGGEQPQADAPEESGGTVQNVSDSADTQEVDLEFNVQAFAESYPVYAMTGANLRATPSQDGDIIQTIASGSSVTALGYTDRWYKVQSNGVTGYVNRNLFSDEPAEE